MLAQGVGGGSQACTTPPGLLKKVRIEEKEKISVGTHKWSWNKQKCGHGFWWSPKPRMTVLEKASSTRC
jgi:hypothetical protein